MPQQSDEMLSRSLSLSLSLPSRCVAAAAAAAAAAAGVGFQQGGEKKPGKMQQIHTHRCRKRDIKNGISKNDFVKSPPQRV